MAWAEFATLSNSMLLLILSFVLYSCYTLHSIVLFMFWLLTVTKALTRGLITNSVLVNL